MEQCIQVLEEVENGLLSDLDLLELMACTAGCVGGPLVAINPAIATFNLQMREKSLREKSLGEKDQREKSLRERISERDILSKTKNDSISCLRVEDFIARPALLLDPDFKKAMKMMEKMEQIIQELPGLDCGCCGAPNCRALAEDIVRGVSTIEDCVFILKEKYKTLLEDLEKEKSLTHR